MAGGAVLRLLGLDVGASRIGAAISDPTGILVSPLAAVRRASLDDDLAAIAALAREHDVASIVVGLPLSLSGGLGPQGRAVRDFIRALSDRSAVPVHAQDERFSTVEAERLLREAGHSPSRNKGLRDSAAACVILQAYMDARRA